MVRIEFSPRKPPLHIHFLLSHIYFWSGSSVSLILYMRTICFLRRRRSAHSARTDTLSNIFSVIVLAWILCEGPNVIYSVLQFFIWEISGCNSRAFDACNPVFCNTLEVRLILVKEVFLALKNLFPVVNTVLIILLMRQLQAPFLRAIKWIRGKPGEVQ